MTISGGNLSFNASSLFDEPIDLSVNDLIQLILDTNQTKINVDLNPLVEQLIANFAIPNELSLRYKVSEGFDDPNGKFPNTFGNVALVDCHGIAN